MIDFMNSNEPNFIFKNINALIDMDCIIESELPEVMSRRRIEEVAIIGRSGTLTEWYGDYEMFNLEIGKISIPYNQIEEVKRWLSGPGKLITHNDFDKYLIATPSFSENLEFKNEWGAFYSFELTFRCQPFKRKLREPTLHFDNELDYFFNPGMINSFPHFKIVSNGGDVRLNLNGVSLDLLDCPKDQEIFLNCEKGMIFRTDSYDKIRTIGDWPEVCPGENKINFSGAFKKARMKMRSIWL